MCLPRFEEVEHFVFEKEILISLLRFVVGVYLTYSDLVGVANPH